MDECKRHNFMPPESTILHMMAHSKPVDLVSAVEWSAYMAVLDFIHVALPSCRWVDLKNYKGKTALHLAAAGNNLYCMNTLFGMGAGQYQELRLIFYSPIGPLMFCRWILICCGVNMPLALLGI